MNIDQLLASPEGKTLEFKRDISSAKPILRTLVAFANTAGGTLIIGRADDGVIVGVKDVLAEEERLASLIADCIAPAMLPEIEAFSVGDQSLLLVRVAHWPGPFYLKEKGPEEGVYVRLGSTNRKADSAMLEELRRQHSNSAFDQLPCAGTSMASLDRIAVRRWFMRKDRIMDEAALESLGVMVRHGSGRAVSNGGLILFGSEEERQRLFPDARISCARFRGTDKSEFIDRQDMESLLDGLSEVPKFIARNTRLASRIAGMQREDIPEYAAIAIREALVNAVAHADYAATGMRIFVSIFSDRLEIQSPGMLPFGMTMEDFRSGVSRIRNRVISRVLHEGGMMEQWGSGYQRIRNSCREGGYPEPEWQELASCVRVTFRPHPDVPVNVPVNEPVNERQQWFIGQLRKGLPCKAEDVMAQWEVSRATAKRDIADLREKGLIEFVGAPKTGSYRLKADGQND